MYSSRMRTARLFTVSQHALGGGVYPSMHWAGGCIPACTRQKGVCLGGVCPGWCDRHPPVNRMTDRCKNITLPQLRCGW